MALEVKVPQLAESVAEATLAAWRCQVGEAVRGGQVLCDLETDKVTLEVAAPEDGVVSAIAVPVGATVLRDDLLLTLDTSGAPMPAAGSAALASAPAAATLALATVGDVAPPAVATAPTAPTAAATPAAPRSGPAARKLAAEHGIDLAAVTPSLPGRVTKGDVLQYLVDDDPIPAATGLAEVVTAPVPAPAAAPGRHTERVPMTRLRKRAAERLLAAQREAALLTTFNECNLQAIGELRERHREAFEARHGVKLGYMPFFVRAVVEALRRFPIINASVDGDDILYHEFLDIGIAVAAPRGLVVPVLRDADQRSLADIEKAIRDFGLRARENRLSVEELTGGTFTITNGGVFGSLLSTPIVNPPQSAILGMHRIAERPVAEHGQVVIRPMMYLALSYDHRIIDGRDAVSFLVAVKEYLEQPERLLLGL
jgi:2-oxoglutarate dehydrogenase E2 component (dihydrolipoamide succinyltransferase)